MLRRRTHRSSVAAAAALATCLSGLALVPAHAQGHPGRGKFYTTKTPTSVGSGGAVSSVDPEASKIGRDVLRARRQRRRRDHRDGGRTRRHRAVQLRHRRRRLPRLLRREVRQGQHDRRPRDRARVDADDAFIDPATVQPYRFTPELVTSGVSVGTPGTPATWDQALRRFGTLSFKQALRPATRLAARGLRRRQHVPAADAATTRRVPRVRLDA